MATLESEGATFVGGEAAAASGCGDWLVETICADDLAAKRSAARENSSSCDQAREQFRRLECEHGAEADLIVLETECNNRNVILPEQIITANPPEPSDHQRHRGSQQVIIAVSISVEPADR